MDLRGAPLEKRPRHNRVPGKNIAGARAAAGGRCLGMLRWMPNPALTGDPAIGRSLINARSETVAEKPSFRAA